MDWKIEVVFVPVSDADRAKEFYVDRLGMTLDHDHTMDDGTRFVQVTPPGSACSLAFGRGVTEMAPGTLKDVMMVVPDAEEGLAHLRAAGVDARGVDEQPWGRFVHFADPDGNTWALQQLPSYA